MSTHLWAVALPPLWRPQPFSPPCSQDPQKESETAQWSCSNISGAQHRIFLGRRGGVAWTACCNSMDNPSFLSPPPNRFESDLKAMTGHALNWYWKAMWGGVSPLLIISLFVFYLSDYIITGTLQYQAWDASQVAICHLRPQARERARASSLLKPRNSFQGGGRLFVTTWKHHPGM